MRAPGVVCDEALQRGIDLLEMAFDLSQARAEPSQSWAMVRGLTGDRAEASDRRFAALAIRGA